MNLKWRTKKRPNLNISNYPFISQESQMGIRQSRNMAIFAPGISGEFGTCLRIDYDVHLTWNPIKLVRCLSSPSTLFLLIFTIFSSIYSYIDTRILRRFQLDHTHKVPVILYDKLQRQSHTTHSLPISVTWLLLLLNQTNTGTSTALTAETHWSMRTRFRAPSRIVISS
jgi:hypothetical protein